MAEAASAPVNYGAPPNRALLIGWMAMVLGMFMAILDIQIVASSLGDIQAGLSASADEISWVQTSYLIAEVIMIPLSGFLGRWLSTRVLFLWSVIGFTAASLLCSIAWSIESLIAFRALQGFIGGGMIPAVFASLYLVFPPARQAMANMLVGMVVTVAPAIGPTLGGYISEWLGWHWLFLMNLIPGVIVAMMVARMPAIDQGNPELKKGFDFRGLLFMALFLGGLELVLDEGPRKDWFADSHVLQWAVVASISGFLFFHRTLTYTNPIVDLRVFANRNFAFGSAFAFVLGIGLFGSVFSTPLFLARVQGYSPLQIGEVMSVAGITMVLIGPVAGRLAARIDLRYLLGFGMLMATLGLYLNAHLNHDAGFNEFFWLQVLRGAGLMCVILSANVLTLGRLPLEQLSTGSSMYNLSRNMGGAIGLASITTLLESRERHHFSHLLEWYNPARPEFQEQLASLSAQVGEQAAQSILISQGRREALVMAFNDVHLLMMLAFCLALMLIPFIQKPQPRPTPGAMAHE